MIKRTLYFGNPAYLNLKDKQMLVTFPNDLGHAAASGNNSIPVEDVGMVVLDSKQITITHALINAIHN